MGAETLAEVGPMPPAERPGDLALWVTALINPLQPVGIAPEIRLHVLEAESVAQRLDIVRNGLRSSLARLRKASTSPLGRCIRLVRFVSSMSPLALTFVVSLVTCCSPSVTPVAQARLAL